MQLWQKSFEIQVIVFQQKLTLMANKNSAGIFFLRGIRSKGLFHGNFIRESSKSFFAELVFGNLFSHPQKFLTFNQYSNVTNELIRTFPPYFLSFAVSSDQKQLFTLQISLQRYNIVHENPYTTPVHFSPKLMFIHAKGGP